jgi:protein phosphatase
MIAAELTELMQNKPRMLVSKMLAEAVKKTNEIIFQISQQEPQCAGMGTTLVAGIFTENKLVLGHIGDSRMYRLRGGKLTQMTEDHSLIQEQINAGLITPEQAAISTKKNLVTRALGVDVDVKLGLQTADVNVGDVYMLCSDGLSDLVEDAQMTQILAAAGSNIDVAAQKLVDAANDNGGTDNISVVIAYIKKPFMVQKSWVKHLFSHSKQRKIV